MFKDIFPEIRKEKGLYQKDIARIFNLHHSSISAWEVGKSEPDLTTLSKLADFFNCSIDYLVGRENDFGNVQIENDFTTKEREIINFYRMCDDEGKGIIYGYSKAVAQKLKSKSYL
jgi:transcriptional regulator with XRE-family HTH domain